MLAFESGQLFDMTQTKDCRTCGTSKTEGEFPSRGGGKRGPDCKTCTAVKKRAWYVDHAEPARAKVSSRRRLLREKLREGKDRPCADCGVQYPYYVMQYDHVRGVKSRAPTRLHTTSPGFLERELAKCEVVCANCHAIRTHARKHGSL